MSAAYVSSVFFSGSPRNDAGPVADSTAPILTSASATLAPNGAASTAAAMPIAKVERFIIPSRSFTSLVALAHGRRSRRRHANPTKALFGAVGAVSGVAQARNDVGVVVEAFVDCGSPQLDIRMNAKQPLDALGRCDQARGADVLCAALFEAV